MKQLLEKLKTGKTLPFLLALTLLGAGIFLLLPPSSSPSASSMTEEESRISHSLSRIKGAGETRVILHYREESSSFGSSQKTPYGAVIISRGAGDIAVKIRLMEAAQALLGLDSQSIAIFPMEAEP